jgi:hypothetical protein
MVIGIGRFHEGMAFLIPCKGGYILAQVGRGGDLGVFRSLYKEPNDFRREHLESAPIFRVHFGALSPKTSGWTPLGVYPLGEKMSKSALYYHQAVGDDHCFIVQHGMEDRQVNCGEVKHIEPLATWSHEHIVKRFDEYCEEEGGE